MSDEARRVSHSAPDHTTPSRRGRQLDAELRRIPSGEAIHLIVDSSGLSIAGEGEWAAAKHGGKGKRGWKKLHFGVDGSGVIVAQVLTDGNSDDATTAAVSCSGSNDQESAEDREAALEGGFRLRPPRHARDAFFRYKSIIGERLRARHPMAQETEALFGCNALNRMLELGRPVSCAIGA